MLHINAWARRQMQASTISTAFMSIKQARITTSFHEHKTSITTSITANLLQINAAGQEIGGDQHKPRATTHKPLLPYHTHSFNTM
jgi:hypothetical protein